MHIETGKKLVFGLRTLCDGVKKRLWIATPFIGYWTAVRKIIGRAWLDNGKVDVRLITDTREPSNLNYETIKHFYDRGKIKNLLGLHAKIYIIDDLAVLTSANLTKTAFAKRYEVGIFLSELSSKPLINLFDKWWEHISEQIPQDWPPEPRKPGKSKGKEETDFEGLRDLCELPPDPGDPCAKIAPIFREYDLFLQSYYEFADIYKKIQRIWPNSPLYFETDSFLNYLFHQAPGKPSHQYDTYKPRLLTRHKRVNEIKYYAAKYRKWISEGSEGIETKRWRDRSSEIIRELLDKKKIFDLNRDDIESVVNQFNCMNSLELNKIRFLNPRNNDINKIRNSWYNLLYGDASLQTRMNDCKNALYSFGSSSIHELLGFFNPDKYPIRNTNSSSGLRFFGYSVSVY